MCSDMFSGLVIVCISFIIFVTIILKVILIISVWTPSFVPDPVVSPKLLEYPRGLISGPGLDGDFFLDNGIFVGFGENGLPRSEQKPR